jgi:hypothetical protein
MRSDQRAQRWQIATSFATGRQERYAFAVADQSDVRRIAMALPSTVANEDRFGFAVRESNQGKGKAFVWAWVERVDRKPGVERSDVVALRVASELDKQVLITTDDRKFFTEPNYNSSAAVLVRLDEVALDELEVLMVAAWRTQASPRQVAAFDAGPEFRAPKRPRR